MKWIWTWVLMLQTRIFWAWWMRLSALICKPWKTLPPIAYWTVTSNICLWKKWKMRYSMPSWLRGISEAVWEHRWAIRMWTWFPRRQRKRWLLCLRCCAPLSESVSTATHGWATPPRPKPTRSSMPWNSTADGQRALTRNGRPLCLRA